MQRKAHNQITQRLCPDIPLRLINAVNYALDQPSSWAGPSHRRFLHDPISASIMGASVAMKMGFPAEMGVRVAAAHLLEDKASDGMRKVKIGQKVTLKHIFDALTS